jgi:hypothetical protein
MVFQGNQYHDGLITTHPRPPHGQRRLSSRHQPAAVRSRSWHPPLHRHCSSVVTGMIFLRLSAAVCCHREQMTFLAKSDHQQQTFVIGQVPEQSVFIQFHRYEPLVDYRARLAAADSDATNEQFIISRSSSVSENGLAIPDDLDTELKEKHGSALLHMHEDPEGIQAPRDFGAWKLIAIRESEFQAVSEYLSSPTRCPPPRNATTIP